MRLLLYIRNMRRSGQTSPCNLTSRQGLCVFVGKKSSIAEGFIHPTQHPQLRWFSFLNKDTVIWLWGINANICDFCYYFA